MIASAPSLEEANARFQALMSGLHDGVVMQDRHGAIQVCNAAAERILGLTRDQMMGLTSVSPEWRVVHEDGSPFPGEEHPAPVALRTGQPFHGVTMGVHKPDGSLTWILVNATPLFRAGDPSPSAVVSSFADITERVAERAALQAASERAALALESGRIGIWDWDVVHDRMTWDAWMYRLYGLEPSHETGAYDLWSRHLHPDDREAAEQAITAALAGDKPYDIEFRVVWSDGTCHHLRGTGRVTRDAAGRAIRMIGTNWDVTTERRLALDLTAQVKRQAEAEKAMIASEAAARAAEESRRAEAWERQTGIADRAAARFRALLDAAPDTMLVVWQGGNIGLANDRAAKTFGYTREELVGQPIDMLIPERIRGRHKDHLAGYFRSPTARMMGGNLALSGRRKDGSEFPVEVSISPFGFDGEQGVITAVRDVTERKQLEASLEASRQQITNSARLSALGTMAGGIAHEINNPLAVISALADDLKDLAEANAASRDNVLRAANRMLHCTDRIGKIVRSLRYVARDGTRDHFAKASVEDVVFRTLDLTFERFRQNSVELQAPRIDPGLWLECREVNVSQILLNLLQNAFDAAMEAADPRWVRLEVTTQDDQLIFSVIDSGNGVPADVRARIMEPFFTTKPAGKGTGLGLSLSKQMALEHGGKLDLGESGGHTCFSLRLPRTQESPVPCT